MMNKKYLIMLFFIAAALSPHFVLADVAPEGFQNPLGNVKTPDVFIVRVISFLLSLVFVLALLALIVGGVRMVGSFGNEQAVASAKKIILWAIIGLVVTIMSWVIITIVAEEILQVQ